MKIKSLLPRNAAPVRRQGSATASRMLLGEILPAAADEPLSPFQRYLACRRACRDRYPLPVGEGVTQADIQANRDAIRQCMGVCARDGINDIRGE